MPYPDEREIQLPGGITLNAAPDANGVLMTCATLDGWGSPGGTGGVQQRAAAHGGTNPRQWLKPRTLTVTGKIEAPTAALRQDAEHRLEAALGLALFDLSVVDAIPLRVRARREGDITRNDDTDLRTKWQAELVCPDPRRYGLNPHPVTFALPQAIGGMTFPVAFPMSFAGSNISGDRNAPNAGNFYAPATIRFDGPLTTPSLTLVGDGTPQNPSRTLTYNGILAAGEWVVIYTDPLRALLMGNASRTGLVSGSPWQVPPKGNANLIAFRAAAGTGTALLTYDDAYQ
jgi:hypothetical protein